MADAISIIASVIAVVGAVERGVRKTLANVRKHCETHRLKKLFALINEVSDLRMILGDVEH